MHMAGLWLLSIYIYVHTCIARTIMSADTHMKYPRTCVHTHMEVHTHTMQGSAAAISLHGRAAF